MIRDKKFPKLLLVSPQTLQGKAVAIVGGSRGMGRALSQYFAAHNANVTVVDQTFRTGIFAAPARQETAEGLVRDMVVSYLSRMAILPA